MSGDSPIDEAAGDIFRFVEELVGEDRSGGAWIDRDGGREQLGVAVVSPSQGEVTAIQEAARRAGSSVTIDVVKHSRSELIAFYDGMSGPETDSVVGFGWNARVNKVEVMLSGADPEAVAYFRGRIPEDALLIRIVSGRWVAADGG